MNQILSEEIETKKKPKKASINSIIIVFCVFLILFGIGLTSTGAYGYYRSLSGAYGYYRSLSSRAKENQLPSSGTKPSISIERENAYTIKIVATHDKGIEKISYKIDDGEYIEKNGNGRNEVQEEVELEPGLSKISVIAEDINGMTSSYETNVEVEEGPKIKLSQEGTQIKITVESKINIEYVQYYWDDDQNDGKRLEINADKTETLVDVKTGNHTLNIIAKDVEGHEKTKNQRVIGDNKPILNITVSPDGQGFLIKASDDEKLSKIEITLNSNETVTETITEAEYSKVIPFIQGENKLIVKVYNLNNISEISRVKYTKE